ncbi:6-phosphogluconate dehydrogenase 2 [Annulohypoxylon truncatum]|uniref:6-phosphogluconate dehydrogenase 2 n=1 Tax=Annulohypoxylon truncatum TaxID=327061 RepID=UPI002007A435|nr:6-phosphogluconate dehydrogenase 2 [Annulohypoxylon truncatum]KAI1207098.1 6-phosphogluconate dehydrogenase 2 [Annulohypoxylon truncatum]
MAPQILWIGLGNMGRGMVKNLVEKGDLDKPVLLYNRTRKRAEELAAKLPAGKTKVVDSVEEGVKRADIIFNILSNDAVVKGTFDTILKGDVAGKLFIECSTIAPETTEEIAKSTIEKGAEFIASPIFGAPPAAEAGQLIFVPAGPKSSIDKLRPYIKGVMGKAEIAFDDKPVGTSLKLKLLGNSFIINMITQLGEGFAVADKTDIGPDALKQFLDLMFGGVHSLYAQRMTQGTYWKMAEPLFSADNARKDVGHAMKMAKNAGAELKLTKVADDYLKSVADYAGGDKGDVAGIYGAARRNAGLEYENDA